MLILSFPQWNVEVVKRFQLQKYYIAAKQCVRIQQNALSKKVTNKIMWFLDFVDSSRCPAGSSVPACNNSFKSCSLAYFGQHSPICFNSLMENLCFSSAVE